MVQLQKLTGPDAGMEWVVNDLPIRIGRASDDDLQLTDPGVWDHHVELSWQAHRIQLSSRPEALTAINGQSSVQAELRNGDRIEMGGCQIRFWIGPTKTKPFRLRELLFWVGLGTLVLTEAALLWWLGL